MPASRASWAGPSDEDALSPDDDARGRLMRLLKAQRDIACAAPDLDAVFRVLAKHISKGQADKVAGELPAEIRALWPSDAQRAADIRPLGVELERAK